MDRIGPFTISDQSQPAKRALPWHTHDAPLLSLVVSGQYEEGFGRRRRECLPNDLVVKPAGERHYDRVGTSGARSLLVEIDPGHTASIQHVVSELREPVVLSNPSIRRLVRNVVFEYQQRDDFSDLALEALLLEVLVRAARGHRRAVTAAGRPGWLIRAEDCLRDAGPRPTVGAVARTCGVHPATLARVFRKWHGCSVGEFMRQRRVEMTVQALVESDRPLGEIAHEAGFFDQSHMGRATRRYAGLTPAEIRARRVPARTIPH